MLTLSASTATRRNHVSGGTLVAGADTALGAPTPETSSSTPASATLAFTSPAPTIGASSSDPGAASVVLGNAGGEATTLTTNSTARRPIAARSAI